MQCSESASGAVGQRLEASVVRRALSSLRTAASSWQGGFAFREVASGGPGYGAGFLVGRRGETPSFVTRRAQRDPHGVEHILGDPHPLFVILSVLASFFAADHLKVPS